MIEEIKYQAIWGKLYILLGVLFGLLFIFGGILLKDYSVFLNILASAIVIYLGYNMLKRPYARFGEKEIIVYGFFGSVRKHYEFENKDKIVIQGDRLYLNNVKLKINPWMIDKKDWSRLLDYFNPGESIINELQE